MSDDDKKHICVTCGKYFKFKLALNIHNRIHTGEKLLTVMNVKKVFYGEVV